MYISFDSLRLPYIARSLRPYFSVQARQDTVVGAADSIACKASGMPKLAAIAVAVVEVVGLIPSVCLSCCCFYQIRAAPADAAGSPNKGLTVHPTMPAGWLGRLGRLACFALPPSSSSSLSILELALPARLA